jgi:arylsulfatase A-like enzyme/tetratricopeptide (TPR) repeat protein
MSRALAMLLLLAAGCTEPPAERPPRSVLLVTIDTTRADRLGLYGYAQADTPTLDTLGGQGTTYLRAYSSAPLSLPSLSTLHTGLYPPSHGVRDDADFVLDPELRTLAERLRDAGWRTAAFTSSVRTRSRWGLDQGFEVYHDPQPGSADQLEWRHQRRADEVVDDAIHTLQALGGDQPVFAWVHLFDPHWPYDPPEPWATAHLGRPYDGELAFVDAQLGRLIEAWDGLWPREDALVLLTSPHGEGLGDGGEQTHGFLLQDGTVRVPLVLRGGDVRAGLHIDDPVSHVDVVPTLLAQLGLPGEPELPGHDLLDGGSEVTYSEATTGWTSMGLAPLYAVTTEQGRYIEGAWGQWHPMLDDRVSVVGTREDPEGTKAELLHAMRVELPEFLAPESALDPQALQMLSALGYLGGGDPHAQPGDVDPRDLMDAIPLTWQVRQLLAAGLRVRARSVLDEAEVRLPENFATDLLEAQLLRSQGRHVDALHAFHDLYLRYPSATLALQVSRLQATLGDDSQAAWWAEEAGRHLPDNPEVLIARARSALALGDVDHAEDLAAQAFAHRRELPDLTVLQAELWLARGQLAAALETSAEALAERPSSSAAHRVRGEVLWALGDSEEAIEALRQSLRLDPLQAGVRLVLVQRLLELGRNAEAVRIIAPLARLLPDDPRAQELYTTARASMTVEQRHEIRRDRALGPAGGRR